MRAILHVSQRFCNDQDVISPGVAPLLHGFMQRESGNPRKGGEEWHFQIVVMEQAL
jgi:hypothetical protein